MTTPSGSTAADYLAHAAQLLQRAATQRAALAEGASAIARTLVAGGLVHVFGSGHSHMLALEGFYRAGGLAAVNPVLIDSLMLHSNAVLSTRVERTPGLGDQIFADLDPDDRDAIILVSNSGGNRVAVDLGLAARDRGIPVVAIVSLAHAGSSSALQAGSENLIDVADVVLDNGGVAGDAAISIPGVPAAMGPTSTVVGAALIHALCIDAVRLAVAEGWAPEVFSSSNVAGGDARNAEVLARYRGRVRSL